MPITDSEKRRLNESMPVANDVKLGDIIQSLQSGSSGGTSVTSDQITDATAVGKSLLKAADAAAARTAIGAGTSNLALGTTASTAAAGNHTHTIANVTGLQTALDAKLTASKAATQANSTATDVTGLVADFNALLAKLKTAGIMS